MLRSKRVARVGLVAVFGLVFMSVGLVSASAGIPQEPPFQPVSIWAESNDCASVTIYFAIEEKRAATNNEAIDYPGFNAQGTVNGVVKNGNGVGWMSMTFQGVTPGTANWSGSMWWDWQGPDQYFNQGTVEVEPCPTTTTPTTQPESTTSSTIAQVETDIANGDGSSVFGWLLVLAGFVALLLGGAAARAARIED